MRSVMDGRQFRGRLKERIKHFYTVVISGRICPQKYQSRFASHLFKALAE